ncbi:MAG: Txe/YoeB family addiction module toxin [Asticcacaulis sp.]
MRLAFDEDGWDDYLYWQSTDKTQLKRLNILIKEVLRHPFEGIGQPEPLRHERSGYWSRRIDQEHRLVYKVTADEIIIAQCRFHY